MEWWAVIYGFTMVWIVIGAILHPFIKRKTNYKGNTQGDHDNILIWWVFFGGFFTLFFLKRIKKKRTLRYLKNRINYYKWCDTDHLNTGYKGDKMFDGQIKKMERIVKIIELHQKSKKNKLKKKYTI